MVAAQGLVGNAGQSFAKASHTVFTARYIREDFGAETHSNDNYGRYTDALNAMSSAELKIYEKYLLDNNFVSGVSARERQQAQDLWNRNTLRYCKGEDNYNHNYPKSAITSARDTQGTQSPTGGDKWASDPDFQTADVLRINKVQCYRMSVYHRIEADRLRAEALAMLEDAKIDGQNAAILDLKAKTAGFVLVTCGVAAIFTIGALALVNAGAIAVAGGRAILSVGGAFAKFGWLGQLLTVGLATALPTIWGYAVQAFYFVYHFDWNISDKQIDQTSGRGVSAIAGSLGAFVGSAAGWLACGIAPAAAIAVADPLLGLLVEEEVNEQAIQHLSSRLWGLVNQTSRQATRIAFLQAFKFTRRWVQDPGSIQYNIFTTAFGKDAINNWGKGKPFTIVGEVNEGIASVSDNPYIKSMLGQDGANALRNFLSNTVEGFINSCVDAGFAVTSSYSTALLLQHQTQTSSLGGNMKTVEIQFQRSH